MIDTIIFDLDGTLLDTIGDLNCATNHILKKNGLSKVSVLETKNYIGNGIKNLIIKSLKGYPYNDLMFDDFMNYYNLNLDTYTKPYDGIVDTLKELKRKKYKLGCISNKNIVPLTKLINKFFPNLFDIVLGDGMGYKRKPDSEIIIACANKLNSNTENILYIGDSIVDYNTIINSNISGIIVTYGYGKEEDLNDLNILKLDNIKDIFKVL